MRCAPIRSSLASRPATVQHRLRLLAWLLAIADNILLIPGTGSRGHLAENLAAESFSLRKDEVASLSAAFGEPCPPIN